MATNSKQLKPLDIPFKEFMPGQVIQSVQFNDDMRDIEDTVNELVNEHNIVSTELSEHVDNLNNPHQVDAHQTGTYNATEIDEFFQDIKGGNLHDNAITNRVLDDECIDTRNYMDNSITVSKLDISVGNQIDISQNISIADRYTKDETDLLIQEKVGDGTYDKATIDEKLEQIQAGQILDKSISIQQLKDDVGRRLDISNNPDIINKYTREEVDLLLKNNALPRDWGSILEEDVDTPVEIPTREITLPVANHMKVDTFTVSESSILDVDIQENVDARGEYNTIGERLNNVDSQINDIETRIDNIGGSSGGNVDLSGYVTKEIGNANQITFADGQTFQAKLDAGMLKGDKGEPGVNNIDDTTASANTTYSSNKIESIKEGLNSQIADIKNGYTLPVATSETLGGVKPVTKTDEMTQPVGVTEEGLLYTAPSTVSGSINEDVFKKVIETTFGEECYAFTVTQDKNGNPIQLKEGIIRITTAQPLGTSTNLKYAVGFVNWSTSYNGNCSIYMLNAMKNYEFYASSIYFKVINQRVLAIDLGQVRYGTNKPTIGYNEHVSSGKNCGMTSFRLIDKDYIDRIIVGFDMANTGLFSKDSLLEVWGI